jgi:methionine-rich copper-binding protein CopC
MKNLSVFLAIFLPIFCFSQVNETFLDGNFINNPIWTGTSSNFSVNTSLQLQSKATLASTSYLFTPSEAIDDATWECWVKINYNPSSSNYASIYLVSDKNDLSLGCNGYYVQVGGTNDEVSLFVQEGTTKTKIIDGSDKRTDRNPVELRIKVTRDADGNFALYSKLVSETDYVLEGTTQNTTVKSSNYFGLLYVNTASTGMNYFFDDILVTGNKAVDKEPPIWSLFNIMSPNKLKLGFSEAMNFFAGSFTVDNGMGSPVSTIISTDKTSLELTFGNDFQKGKIYNLQTSGLTDLGGNQLELTKKSVGIVEKKEIGDLIFNEVMFENPETSLEYIEIYNKSDKLLDVSGMIFTTRKADGTMNTGNIIPKNTSPLPPKGYLAFCSNAEMVRSFHACQPESNIISTSWTTLNNESSTLVFTNAAKDSIFDELKYDVKWHNSWVVSPKGISLERTSPDLVTQDPYSWHSSTAVGNNGTPGYQNSVYVDTEQPIWNSLIIEQPNKLKLGFSERMNFLASTFTVDNGMGNPIFTEISTDKTSITLVYASNFEKGKIYNLQTTGLADLAGNVPATTQKSIGIVEKKEIGDLIFNEVMFENPENSLEYIEIYNKSDKLLDVSGMVFTTRKTDGTMNTGISIPKLTPLLPPKGYLVLCSNAETVRSFHTCPPESTIISTLWTALNNESSTLVLTSAVKDSIFDELRYDVKWHNSWVVSPKGIALERTSPDLVTQDACSWHSANSNNNYGTPGYQNSVYVDTELPIWNSLIIEQPNKLELAFSERMNFSASTFTVDNGMGSPVSTIISADKTSIELTFTSNFEKGKIYNLATSGLTDLAGNIPTITQKSIGIVEKKEIGDLIFNEVMFENPENSLEYIEIYNKSDKLLDVSGLIFTTRKTDGTMNTGVIIPKQTPLLPPKGYLALCSNAETVRSFHACPPESTIISTSWTALNNESSTLVLTSAAKDSIFDELKYEVKWHNSWVVSPKGIALERTSPDLITQDAYSWHSASSNNNFGTPGYQNSVYVDTDLPIWNSLIIEQPNKLKLSFSERMDFLASTFILDNGMASSISMLISADKTSIELTFANDFQKGKIYNLHTSGLTDLAGNQPELKSKSIGIVEKKEIGDLIFNEVMFENPETSLEYIEIYNKSDKLLDVSGMIFTTRKTDGTMNTGNVIPAQTHIQPHGYIAFCSDAELLRSYHSCPVESNIISTEWNSLNNESTVLVLTNSAKDSIFDELQYNVKWHNALVKNPKGVALERINPELATQNAASWHSAASTTNFGTPGYQNSQFRDLLDAVNVDKFVWTEPESFSPDNDGINDVCVIKYRTDAAGYVANVMILNAVGVRVVTLGANILLPTEGFLIWDGKTGSGKNANVGIYVLYFEMFNPNTGERKRQKLPIVVSSL